MNPFKKPRQPSRAFRWRVRITSGSSWLKFGLRIYFFHGRKYSSLGKMISAVFFSEPLPNPKFFHPHPEPFTPSLPCLAGTAVLNEGKGPLQESKPWKPPLSREPWHPPTLSKQHAGLAAPVSQSFVLSWPDFSTFLS